MRRNSFLFAVALATVAIHWVAGAQYGFHRDELATLDDARHLAWGFPAYPPLTPFFGRLSLELFGTSLAGFRFFASLVDGAVIVLAGLMAREMGGGGRSEVVAALAATPFSLAAGALMQYVSFDYFFWVLTAYFVVRLLKREDSRWWLAIGASVELGFMTKYTIAFFVAGVLGGFALSDARQYLRSKWLVAGAAVMVAVCLPNLIWQAQHGFVSLAFLQRIHARDVRIGRADGFLPDQVKFTLFGFFLALVGLWSCFREGAGRRFRAIGWMYVIPLVLFLAARGRSYYLAAAYPMLFAAGGVWLEGRLGNGVWRSLVGVALAADIVLIGAIFLPMAPVNSGWWRFASGVNGDLREEIGWEDLAREAARVRDSLPAGERARLGILTGNYGEAGALNLYGPALGLPRAISGVNSFWYRGYGDPAPETLIVFGLPQRVVDANFVACEVVGRVRNRYGVANEESTDLPAVRVCRGLRRGWPEIWAGIQSFG